MKVITFYEPYVTPTEYTAIEAEYHFQIVDGERNFKGKVIVSVTGEVAGEYHATAAGQLYDEPFLRTMFPYVLSYLKDNPYTREHKLIFTTTYTPCVPDAEWDGSKEIENYVLEF